MSSAADAPREILLRGNARPAVGLAVVAAVACASAAVILAALSPPAWLLQLAAVVAVIGGAILGCGAWSLARPRLVRRGSDLEVRVAPFAVERVPLELVECVFPGSQPLGGDAATGASPRRVTTLIVRLAERATAWARRPGMAWVTWDDGAIVIDGRWCEPLSPASVRVLAARLIDIKRELAEPEA